MGKDGTVDSTVGDLHLLSDDPISTPDEDLLDHYRFAEQLVGAMNLMRTQTASGAAVLAGPWGSGKSSVLRMLEAKLEKGQEWSVVSFNPWLLSDDVSLIQQFFASLAAVLPEKRQGKRVRERLATYLSAVAPAASVVRLPLVDVGKAATVAAEFLAGDEGLEAKRREVEKALQQLSSPVLVLLDDLDRLHPRELVLVFKLVRLIGRLPNIYYLLAFDEETVVDLLEASEVSGGARDRGYTFLEKIYQVRLELPPLHQSRRARLVDRAMESFLSRQEESLTAEDQYRFSSAYHTFMAQHLQTPRQIKRYLAQADIHYPFLKGEVDLVDFLLVTFVRASLPRLYDLLASSKNVLTLTFESVSMRDDRPLDDRRKDWATRLTSVGIAEAEVGAAMKFLGQLFLPIKSIVEMTNYGSEYYEQLARHRQVGSADYFDRYFFFGIQPDDVPDQLVDGAIAELETTEGPQTGELRLVFSRHANVVFEKLLRRRDGLSENQRAGVLLLLADCWEAMPDQMFISTKRRAVLFGAEILAGANPERIDVDRLASSPSRLVFAAEALSRLFKRNEDEEETDAVLPDWLSELVGEVVDRAFATLDQASTMPLEGQEEWVVPLLFRLRDLASRQRVTEWLKDTLEQSAWSVEDFAAALVPIATAYGAGRPTKVLAHADVIEPLRSLLPLDWVLERLTGLEDAGEPLDRLTMTEDDLTFENRIRHVKAVLRERLERGETLAEDRSQVSKDDEEE